MEKPFSKIIVGTAQLGMPYGMGQWADKVMPEKEAFRILDGAWERGFTTLDTSPDYGLAVERIVKFMRVNPSKVFTVITKIKDVPERFTKKKSLLTSSKAHLLSGLSNLDQLHILVHNEKHICHKLLIDELNSAEKNKKFNSWGAAVYSVESAEAAVNTEGCSLLNVPINFFNKTFLDDCFLSRCKDRGISVIARSVFARGIILSKMGLFTKNAGFETQVNKITAIARSHKLSLPELCVLFAISDERVGHAVVGFDDERQLNGLDNANIEANINKFGINFWQKLRLPEFSLGKPENWTFSNGALTYTL